MASKKQKRTEEVRSRKKKKGWKNIALSAAALALVGLLIFFFVTLFDALFPTSGKGTAKKKEKLEVTLYFSDANERFFVPEKRFVPKEASAEEQAREIVRGLTAGSKTGNASRFKSGNTARSSRRTVSRRRSRRRESVSGRQVPR